MTVPPPESPTSQIEWQERAQVTMSVNGARCDLDVSVRTSLADAIRGAGLTGTHVGCEHGVCGSCTVLLDGAPVRSCLVLAVQASGAAVETIEGHGDGGRLTRLQEAFHECGALQCGFCTPGFVLLASWLLEREPAATDERIREVLSANLCRCTGYDPIVAAVREARDGGRG